MIVKNTEIRVKLGMESEFIAAIEKAQNILADTDGFHGLSLIHSLDLPELFVLSCKWESLTKHADKFINSPNFTKLWALILPCLEAKPRVYVNELLIDYSKSSSDHASRMLVV